MDLRIALQVIPSSMASLDTKANNDPINSSEISVMGSSLSPKQCPTRWVLFGGICAQGVDFLRGKCVDSACIRSDLLGAFMLLFGGKFPQLSGNPL